VQSNVQARARVSLGVGILSTKIEIFYIYLQMRVYLDNCCFNRPFDDQSNIMNRMESDAKLFIQEQIKNGIINLVWSSVNEFENNDNPSFEKRERIAVWKQIAVEHCNLNETILDKALELEKIGLRSKDALHIACAIFAKADFFITTDKKILNKDVSGISLANPITFVEEFLYDK